MFEAFRKSMHEWFKSTEKLLDDVEVDLKDLKADPNTETKTVSETKHTDGSITIKTTTVRKIVVGHK